MDTAAFTLSCCLLKCTKVLSPTTLINAVLMVIVQQLSRSSQVMHLSYNNTNTVTKKSITVDDMWKWRSEGLSMAQRPKAHWCTSKPTTPPALAPLHNSCEVFSGALLCLYRLDSVMTSILHKVLPIKSHQQLTTNNLQLISSSYSNSTMKCLWWS